jgi:hypothetical protein
MAAMAAQRGGTAADDAAEAIHVENLHRNSASFMS